MAEKKPDSFITEFNSNPSEDNWELFMKHMKKDKARYYYIVYPGSLKGKGSLRNAYAVIYNGSGRQMYKVPIIKEGKKSIEGATIYFKGLEVNRKVI
ncbi:MAG: hypothetical protein ACREBH_00850 [Candidatus Micrarchaeaceae archaeon]